MAPRPYLFPREARFQLCQGMPACRYALRGCVPTLHNRGKRGGLQCQERRRDSVRLQRCWERAKLAQSRPGSITCPPSPKCAVHKLQRCLGIIWSLRIPRWQRNTILGGCGLSRGNVSWWSLNATVPELEKKQKQSSGPPAPQPLQHCASTWAFACNKTECDRVGQGNRNVSEKFRR